MNQRTIGDARRYPGFHVRFRGFDRIEVVEALAKLASENDDARREIERLDAEMDQLQASMAEQVDSERHVQRALVAASKAADDIRAGAEEEARRILRDAEHRGEQLIQRLQDQAHGIEAQIEALLARRRDVEVSIESFIKVVAEKLEHVRQHQVESDETANGALAQTG